MPKKVSGPNGGPKSPQGKKRSSRNAIKYGIYVDGFIAHDDPVEHQRRVEQLCAEWGVADTVGTMMADRVVHYDMRSKRLDRALESMISERLYSEQIRVEFCKSVGLSEDVAPGIPQWYLELATAPRKQLARLFLEFEELHHFDANLDVQELSTWTDGMGYFLFPTLWGELFGQEVGTTQQLFFDCLKEKFEVADDREAFELFVQHCFDTWHYEFDWLVNMRRYCVIARGIRARVAFDITTDPKYLKAQAFFQRRAIEALQVMGSVKNQLVIDVNDADHKAIGLTKGSSQSL